MKIFFSKCCKNNIEILENKLLFVILKCKHFQNPKSNTFLRNVGKGLLCRFVLKSYTYIHGKQLKNKESIIIFC